MLAALLIGWLCSGTTAWAEDDPPEPAELAPGPPVVGQSESENGDAPPRDALDARAPHDPNRGRRLRRAETLLQEEQWKPALQLLGRLLRDGSDDMLIRRPDGRWVSTRAEANRLLGEIPEEQLQLYRLQHGPKARRRFDTALETGNRRQLAEVAARFFHTRAGREAANRLGTLHLDRGEYGPAVRWFERLLECDDSLTQTAPWRLKAALAFQRAGRSEKSQNLLNRLQSTEHGTSVRLGDRRIDLDDWPEPAAGVSSETVTRTLRDWPLFLGSPRRTGTAVGGQPFLLPTWSHPLTYSRPVREQIELLVEDLRARKKAAVPAWFPLMVDGKIVLRTLRCVQVLEAETGDLLWETRSAVPPEALLTGRSTSDRPDNVRRARRQQRNRPAVPSYSGEGDRHPLAGLLFRNGTYGILSSDGEALYVLEDHAVLSPRQPGQRHRAFQGGRSDPHHRDWSSNRLRAYDLETGRPQWDVGGTATGEPFDLPLAGTCFLGPPTPVGDRLFVIGERDGEIRLMTLDRGSGRPRWSQLIAYADAEIAEDLGRRWWSSQPSVGEGIVVCPTTVGWLVGVDRLSGSLLWAYRYSASGSSENEGRRRDSGLVPFSPLNSRWSPSAPVIAGHRVIYTPPEEDVLVCLDLYEGTLLWERAKDDFLYLGGVFDGRVVLVGKDSMTALALDDGQSLWNVPVPAADGRPSGFGVAAGDRYYLPLSSGQLWTVDLDRGRVTDRAHLPEGRPPLGNLGMHRGMLVSLSPFGLTGFAQRDAVLAEIRRRKAEDPHAPAPLLREAELHLTEDAYQKALTALRRIRTEALSPDQARAYRKRTIETLTAIIRTDVAAHATELEQLGRVVETEAERFHHRRLKAEHAAQRGDHAEAFRLYRTLAEEQPDRRIRRADVPEIMVRSDRWIAGQLADLWEEASAETRHQLDERIDAAADEVLEIDPESQEDFVARFDFHPASVRVRRHLAETYAQSDELLRAEQHLLTLRRSEKSTVAADALVGLVRLMERFGLRRDKLHYVRSLRREFSDTRRADGTTVRAWLEDRQLLDAGARSGRPSTAWSAGPLELTRSGAGYHSAQIQHVRSGAGAVPFFGDHALQLDGREHRLEIFRKSDGALHWLVPLRRGSEQGRAVARSAGHRLVLLHEKVLHGLSPVDRRVLWTHPLDDSGGAGSRRTASPMPRRSMQSGPALLSQMSLEKQAQRNGMLAASGLHYVAVYGGRSLTVLDPLTGEVLWTYQHLRPDTTVYGTDEVIYLRPPDPEKAVALRARDGKPLDVSDVSGLIGRAIHVTGNSFVVLRTESTRMPEGTDRRFVLRQTDPRSESVDWEHEFPREAQFSMIEPGHLAVLVPGGEEHHLAWVDLQSGGLTRSEPVPEADPAQVDELHVLADRENVYLIINEQQRERTIFSSGGLNSLRVNGALLALDRSTGQRRWRTEVHEHALVVEQLDDLPFLVFAVRTYVREEQGDVGYWSLKLSAVEKGTGDSLLEREIPFNSSLRTLSLHPEKGFVELRSYNERLRLRVGK